MDNLLHSIAMSRKFIWTALLIVFQTSINTHLNFYNFAGDGRWEAWRVLILMLGAATILFILRDMLRNRRRLGRNCQGWECSRYIHLEGFLRKTSECFFHYSTTKSVYSLVDLVSFQGMFKRNVEWFMERFCVYSLLKKVSFMQKVPRKGQWWRTGR